MTKPDLMAELAEVVRLCEATAPTPWSVVTTASNPYWRGDGTELLSGYGRIADCGCDGLRTLDSAQANASLIAAAVNFIRNHHAAIEVMARKAATHDLSMGRMYVDEPDGFIRRITTEAVPHDCGDQAMHNSAREG